MKQAKPKLQAGQEKAEKESTLQRHLNGLEDSASKIFMRLDKDKWNVLHRV